MIGIDLNDGQVRRLLDGAGAVLHRRVFADDFGSRVRTISRVGGFAWAAFGPDRVLVRYVHPPIPRGDLAFVREAWSLGGGRVHYRADGPADRPWAPPSLMPPNAARLHVSVGAVRPARLHDVAARDAVSTGAWTPPESAPPWPACGPVPKGECVDADYLRDAFARAWAQSHGQDAWDANPWIWRLELHPTEKEKRRHG